MKISIPTRSHTVRFPQDLYELIHILADNNGRTFNGQVVYMLTVAYRVLKKHEEQKETEDV
jgi:hypothetical protein